jgi:hypothetical protein
MSFVNIEPLLVPACWDNKGHASVECRFEQKIMIPDGCVWIRVTKVDFDYHWVEERLDRRIMSFGLSEMIAKTLVTIRDQILDEDRWTSEPGIKTTVACGEFEDVIGRPAHRISNVTISFEYGWTRQPRCDE